MVPPFTIRSPSHAAVMDHDMPMALTGSFQGHILPAIGFFGWAVWWTFELIRERGRPRGAGALERDLTVSLGKIGFPLIGLWAELIGPGDHWAGFNNFQHATMYSGFLLSGVVDVLARLRWLPERMTYLTFALAAAVAGFLFAAHGHMGGLADTVHGLLAPTFYGIAAVAVAESFSASPWFRWIRIGLMYLLGTWLAQIAFLLYRSDWDLMDHVASMAANLYFTWHVLGVVVGLTVLRIALLGRRPAGT